MLQHMDQVYPILSHTLDKVRYFRDLLIREASEGEPIHIIVGHGATGKTASFQQALDDVEMGYVLANQICILHCDDPIPFFPVRQPRDRHRAILVYFRCILDPFVDALLAEYGADNCEVILFERDPTFV